MTGYTDLAIVILAAGNSSRMGTSKQLLEIDGQTMVGRTVSCSLASNISDVTVVLGANASENRNDLERMAIHVEVNPDWNLGMGNTIKFAVKSLLRRSTNVQALIFLVCDQPQLSSSHLNAIANLYTLKKPIAIASQYKDTYGIPALFDRSAVPDLLLINDKSGAKEVLKRMERNLELIPFEGGEVDLDTPDDYQQFINQMKTGNPQIS